MSTRILENCEPVLYGFCQEITIIYPLRTWGIMTFHNFLLLEAKYESLLSSFSLFSHSFTQTHWLRYSLFLSNPATWNTSCEFENFQCVFPHNVSLSGFKYQCISPFLFSLELPRCSRVLFITFSSSVCRTTSLWFHQFNTKKNCLSRVAYLTFFKQFTFDVAITFGNQGKIQRSKFGH